MDAKELGEQPAYLVTAPNGDCYSGLTKREAFAMAAMGPLCRLIPSNPAVSPQEAVWIAQAAIRCADMMLAELTK